MKKQKAEFTVKMVIQQDGAVTQEKTSKVFHTLKELQDARQSFHNHLLAQGFYVTSSLRSIAWSHVTPRGYTNVLMYTYMNGSLI